jgi:hypothetical protein
MIRRLLVLAFVMLVPATAAIAQNSIYGVRGIGFPSRPLSARARALAGADAYFDRLSAVNPAAAGGHGQVTAAALMTNEFRRYDALSTEVGGLRATRFPLAMVGGRLGGLPFGYMVSFAEYAERSFDVTQSGTVVLRGQDVAVNDRIVSDGGIADIRGALAWTPGPTLRIGGAVHVISGSTKLRVRREFSDSAFRSYEQVSDLGFSGFGFSLGATVAPAPGLLVAAGARVDGGLDATVDSAPAGTVNLPITLGGGVQLTPVPALRVALGAEWRSWTDARPDLDAATSVFNTWKVAGGLEIGGPASGASRMPLRFGARYATLPFAPAGQDQPRELVFAAGTGLPFAGNRATIDAALEHIRRDGAGVAERAWLLTVGVSLRP